MSGQQRLGQFWLAWRTDREEWAICWNDSAAGTRRRKSTGCRNLNDGHPPVEAQQALAEHFARHGKPEAIDPNSRSSLMGLLNTWLAKEAPKRVRAAQYAYAHRSLQRWIETQGQMMVSDVNVTATEAFIAFRRREGVTGETISGELSALRTALNWAADNDLIPYAPRVAKVPKAMRSEPKDIEYSQEQVAALLNAATNRFDRMHVATFTMIMLSTHGRTEAVLELEAEQVRQGLIYFNAKGRPQTSKKRSIVPVTPALAPWLPARGKAIMYRSLRKDGSVYERPTYTIKNSFAGCLSDAGIIDSNGEPLGSPNTLRHTIHTYCQRIGVPQAQIDAAAGHSGERGSGRNYTHLRPEYLTDFIAGVERYWTEMDKLTQAHRSLVGPKAFDIKTGKRIIET
jgi:site-specific recombinase XerD